MEQHEFTPAVAQRLRELQSYFKGLNDTDPDFNFYFVWIHDNIAAGNSDVSDANVLLKVSHLCDKPNCTYYGSSYYHSDNWPEFPDFNAETKSQNDFMDIMDQFPLVEAAQWPDWASAWVVGQDWHSLAARAAAVGLELPSLKIPVDRLIVTAKPIQSDPAIYSIFREGTDEPIATANYSAETKRGLDLLAKTPVTLVKLYGLFNAAAKLARKLEVEGA
jgi:hypothetical protein